MTAQYHVFADYPARVNPPYSVIRHEERTGTGVTFSFPSEEALPAPIMSIVQSDFARVYSEHVSLIYAFLAYRVGNRSVAEDLTEATFERALRAWSRFDPSRGSERAWLLAIARNLLIDNYRRDRTGRTEPISEDTSLTVPGPEARIADTGDLRDALATLSDRDREILVLRFGGDLDGPEIAERLGLTLANVHQISSRSLRKLRGLLEDPPEVALQTPFSH